MENCIFNDNDNSTIGYYSDLNKGLKAQAKEFIDTNDFEQAQTIIEIITELDNWTDNDGLLVLLDNNGMGYTIEKYKGD